MTQFIKQLGNPPIYTAINQSNYGSDNFPTLKGSDMIGSVHADWQKWMQQLTDITNTNNYYGNPSLTVNADFYWNAGVANPVSTDTFFSEKWQVVGAAVATFTLTQTAFAANDSDQIGSTTYIRVQVAAYTSGAFYLRQRQTGADIVRRYQGRVINFSLLAYNNQSKSIKLGLEIFVFFNPSSTTFSEAVVQLDPGANELSSAINTDFLGSTAVGANPYVEFRLRFIDLVDGTADFNLIYLKAEIADQPTILFVDHALERTRITNSTWIS